MTSVEIARDIKDYEHCSTEIAKLDDANEVDRGLIGAYQEIQTIIKTRLKPHGVILV